MDKKQFKEFHEDCLARMRDIVTAKNADYTGDTNDAFANFTRIEEMGITKTEIGFLTRMTDKLCRLNSFVQKGVLEVKDESFDDTCLDLANYAILFAGYVSSKRQLDAAKANGCV